MPAECADLVLEPGTYWISWTSSAGGLQHYHPPATRAGARLVPGANARHRVGGAWQLLRDGGLPMSAPDVPLGFPFPLLGREIGNAIFSDGFESP